MVIVVFFSFDVVGNCEPINTSNVSIETNLVSYSLESSLNESISENDDSIIFSEQSENLHEEALLNPSDILKNIRMKNANRLVLAQININSIRNKFESLIEIISDRIDILLISETKIDSSFPNAHFNIPGYATYRRDRNLYGGGLMLYVKNDLSSKLLKIEVDS